MRERNIAGGESLERGTLLRESLLDQADILSRCRRRRRRRDGQKRRREFLDDDGRRQVHREDRDAHLSTRNMEYLIK